MLPCVDPLDFVRETTVFAALRDGYRDDMARACALAPLREVPGATLVRMPDHPWARRATGMLANERMRNAPHAALAVLSPRADGGSSSACACPMAGRSAPTNSVAAFRPAAGASARAASTICRKPSSTRSPSDSRPRSGSIDAAGCDDACAVHLRTTRASRMDQPVAPASTTGTL